MKQIEIKLLHDTVDGPQKFLILTETTIAYKLKREHVNKELPEPFYDELKNSGVYILFGKTSFDNHDTIYVGQSDNVAKRLYEHKGGQSGEKQIGKVFWNECIAFVTSKGLLQKGHVEYLEVEFYKKIFSAKRYILENVNIPSDKNISERDFYICDDFINDCDLLSRIMGHPIFDSSCDDEKIISKSPELRIDKSDRIGNNDPKYVNATGYTVSTEEFENGFTVLTNSIITKDVTAKASKSIRDMRRFLKRHGYIKEEDGKLIFVKEYTFASPGIAASVVLGRSASAKEWKEV